MYKRSRIAATVAVATTALVALVGCSGGGGAGGKTQITVAYGATYVFDSTPLADKYWNSIKQQFDAAHPNATLQLVPIQGSYNDIVSKLSLDYRSASTAPDVAQLPTGQLGDWQSSGYLLPLDSYLKNAQFWKGFPAPVKSEGVFGGKTYAVSTGENDSALFYNKKIFAQAGLPTTWQPHTWADILTAAAKIKATVPSVTPLWAAAGTSQGTNGILQGGGNLIAGSSDPTIYDKATKKWVVDSAGLRQTLAFYKSVYSGGLGASSSDLFSDSAVTVPLAEFQKGKLAIAIGSNYYFGNWTKTVSAPYWSDAPTTMGVAKIPTVTGGGVGAASTMGGWDLAAYSGTKHAALAEDLITLMESKKNLVNAANWAGFVPPDSTDISDPAFVNFAPPYQQLFGQILAISSPTPTDASYTAWGQGFEEATGLFVTNPAASVDQAITLLKTTVTKSLGASAVETK